MKSKRRKKKENESFKKVASNLPAKDADGSKSEGFDFGGIPDRDLKKNLGCG